MRSQALIQVTIRFGDLIVAIFDEAAHYSTDPKEVSRLATLTLMQMQDPLLREAGLGIRAVDHRRRKTEAHA
jgi:hypothetical protein